MGFEEEYFGAFKSKPRVGPSMKIGELCSRASSLSFVDLQVLERRISMLKDEAKKSENRAMMEMSPLDLLHKVAGDWGGYGSTLETQAEIEAYHDVTVLLNEAAVPLVEHLRSFGSGRGRDAILEDIREAVRNIKALQARHNDMGFDNTEGREALWAVYEAAMIGRDDYNADHIWGISYDV